MSGEMVQFTCTIYLRHLHWKRKVYIYAPHVLFHEYQRGPGNYDGDEGKIIRNIPLSFHMDFHVKFHKNASWSDISYGMSYIISYEIMR